jgi:hypothetical protein
MKRKWYAVILGLLALSSLYFWRAQVSPTQSPVKDNAREPGTATPPPAEKRLHTQSTPMDPAKMERLLERLGADVTILVADTDTIRRDERLQVLVDSIALKEIPTALEFLQRQEYSETLRDLQVLLVRKGASIDPQTAAAWAEQMPAGATRSAAIAGVGVVWANENLVEAARWASKLAEGEDRENGLGHVAFEAARTEPIFALELTADLAPTDARDELVRHAARQWAAQEPVDAAAWASEITNPALREQILSDIAAAWGDTDPVSAAALALKSLHQGRSQEDAMVGIVQHWVQKEPERAAAWVLEFPEGMLQQTALENVVKLWADKDARETEKWIENLPAGSQRDIARSVLAAR